MDENLRKAIEVVGSGAELARRLNRNPQSVYQWEVIPPAFALEIERMTGGQVKALDILEAAEAHTRRTGSKRHVRETRAEPKRRVGGK